MENIQLLHFSNVTSFAAVGKLLSRNSCISSTVHHVHDVIPVLLYEQLFYAEAHILQPCQYSEFVSRNGILTPVIQTGF